MNERERKKNNRVREWEISVSGVRKGRKGIWREEEERDESATGGGGGGAQEGSLNVGFWNVAGVKRKDGGFCVRIKEWDVVG